MLSRSRSFLGFAVLIVLLICFQIPSHMSRPVDTSFSEVAVLSGQSWRTENFLSTSYQDVSNTNASGWGTGTVTSQRDYAIARLDRYLVSEGVQAIDIQGRKAYIATQSASPIEQVLRIANLTNPYQVTQFIAWDWSWSNIYDAKVEGDILYTVARYGDLRLYNVSNPSATPTITDSRPNFGGNRPNIAVQGRFLYGACDILRIVNVEDPYNIFSVSNTSLPSTVNDINVIGDMAYLSANNGFYVVNVSNPSSPSVVSSITALGTSYRLHVDGDIAFYISWSVIQLIDISDPANPKLKGYYSHTNNLQCLASQGHTLFLGDDSGTVVILDVADPMHPTYVDDFSLMTTSVNDLAFYNGDLVIATDAGLEIYRIGASSGGLTNLPLIGTFPGNMILDIEVQGDIAYVAAGIDGLLTLNVSDPANPVLLNQINHTSPVDYDSVEIQGHYCFVADDGGSLTQGLLSFNVTNPSDIQFLDYYPMITINDLVVIGDLAYLAAGNDGLQIINVSIPTNLGGQISNVTGGISFGNVAVQGHVVYATGMQTSPPFDYGFYLYDATNLSSLVLTNQTTKSPWLSDVTVDGDVCILAEGDRGISLQNVTNPFAVSQFSFYDFPGVNVSASIAVFGPYAIVTEALGGIHLLNATNPRNPQLITSYTTPPILAAMATVHGDVLYVSNATSMFIFRLFRSAGATYNVTKVGAQSLEFDSTTSLIENATLTFSAYEPSNTSLTWQLSADGGAHWEPVTPRIMHEFAYRGSDLRWRVLFSTEYDDRSPHLYQVDITYWYNEQPLAPTLSAPQDPEGDGTFNVSWSAAFDFDGVIDHYHLQMSDSNGFATILQEWTPSGTIQLVSNLIGITYYFRVRGFDNDGVPSPWSNIEFIAVANQPPTTSRLNDPGDTDDDGIFTVSWSVSTDPEGTAVEYTLEVFDTVTMDNSLRTWTTGSTNIEVDISDLGSGTYYFAVIAQDEGMERSDWSNVESITVELPTTPTTTPTPPPIPDFLLGSIIIGSIFAVALVLGVCYSKRRRS